jgi:hypothetical protein
MLLEVALDLYIPVLVCNRYMFLQIGSEDGAVRIYDNVLGGRDRDGGFATGPSLCAAFTALPDIDNTIKGNPLLEMLLHLLLLALEFVMVLVFFMMVLVLLL